MKIKTLTNQHNQFITVKRTAGRGGPLFREGPEACVARNTNFIIFHAAEAFFKKIIIIIVVLSKLLNEHKKRNSANKFVSAWSTGFLVPFSCCLFFCWSHIFNWRFIWFCLLIKIIWWIVKEKYYPREILISQTHREDQKHPLMEGSQLIRKSL